MQLSNVNRKKIVQELSDAKVQMLSITALVGNDEIGAEIIFADDTDMQLVQSIIDAHEPTPFVPSPSQEDFLLDLELRMTMLELGLTI